MKQLSETSLPNKWFFIRDDTMSSDFWRCLLKYNCSSCSDVVALPATKSCQETQGSKDSSFSDQSHGSVSPQIDQNHYSKFLMTIEPRKKILTRFFKKAAILKKSHNEAFIGTKTFCLFPTKNREFVNSSFETVL